LAVDHERAADLGADPAIGRLERDPVRVVSVRRPAPVDAYITLPLEDFHLTHAHYLTNSRGSCPCAASVTDVRTDAPSDRRRPALSKRGRCSLHMLMRRSACTFAVGNLVGGGGPSA